MATLRRHRFTKAYLPAHSLLRLLFWLHSTLQHMCQHDIVKAAGQKLPAKHPRGPRFLTLELRYAMSPPVATAPVPQDPDASAKRNVPAPTRRASSDQTKLIYAAYSLGAAPSEFRLNAFPSAKPLPLSLHRLGSLQTTSSPRRIDL